MTRLACSFVALSIGLGLSACEGRTITQDTPTGRACVLINEASTCDAESTAYCGSIEGSMEFGPCIAHDELECEPGESAETYHDELCGQMYKTCVVEGGVPTWVSDTCDTPLILRFDATPIQMVAAESTPMATFDVSMRPDSCISTDWPSATTPWLAIDLDGNGEIDGGHELFGSGSRLANGEHAPHGFIALAEFDANRDGRIDTKDPDFARLLLWRDHDVDRHSNPDELEDLASVGIRELPVAFTSTIECDARGNCANQRAAFEHEGGRGELVDLYLACH